MRARAREALLIVAVSVGVAGLTACGSNGTDAPSATAGPSGVQAEVGNTVNFMSTGTTITLDCADGKSLTVGGSNNTLTVTGTCHSVNIGGADNKVTLDNVDGDITTVGLNNRVIYRNGEPRINDVGSDNSIEKG